MRACVAGSIFTLSLRPPYQALVDRHLVQPQVVDRQSPVTYPLGQLLKEEVLSLGAFQFGLSHCSRAHCGIHVRGSAFCIRCRAGDGLRRGQNSQSIAPIDVTAKMIASGSRIAESFRLFEGSCHARYGANRFTAAENKRMAAMTCHICSRQGANEVAQSAPCWEGSKGEARALPDRLRATRPGGAQRFNIGFHASPHREGHSIVRRARRGMNVGTLPCCNFISACATCCGDDASSFGFSVFRLGFTRASKTMTCTGRFERFATFI
jgi:hypothetical protein